MYENVITAVMSSSAIPSHPSTDIVDRVIEGIRHHLGDIEILLLCDGIRTPEHENRRMAYKEYKSKVLHGGHGQLCLMEWEDSVQQAFMTREALKSVKTPLVLWNEHDYLITPSPIDWEGIINVVQQEIANVVRFHNLEIIHPQHQHLILDGIFEGADGYHGGTQVKPIPIVCGVPLLRTSQFWACPFLTTTKWFREQMEDPRKFSAETYCEIEPALYTWVNTNPDEYKIFIYAPSEPSMRRSQHLGGRGHNDLDPKRDMRW